MRSTYSRVVCYEWECVVNIVSVSLVFVVILFLILTRRRERENDRFPFRPFLPFAFWRKRTIFFFGMKRCALTYAFDGMQPNENIQFQLFALRETDGHILPMYESEYKQHTHTHPNEYSVRLALDVWVLHAYNKMQHIFLRIRLIQAKTSTFSAFSQNMRRRKRTATTHFWIFGGFFRHKLSFCTFFVLAMKILVFVHATQYVYYILFAWNENFFFHVSASHHFNAYMRIWGWYGGFGKTTSEIELIMCDHWLKLCRKALHI